MERRKAGNVEDRKVGGIEIEILRKNKGSGIVLGQGILTLVNEPPPESILSKRINH